MQHQCRFYVCYVFISLYNLWWKNNYYIWWIWSWKPTEHIEDLECFKHYQKIKGTPNAPISPVKIITCSRKEFYDFTNTEPNNGEYGYWPKYKKENKNGKKKKINEHDKDYNIYG